ncbi:MAG: hypothetical protein V1887_01015 [Candidatus Aenigmatarchaeota archaeon]
MRLKMSKKVVRNQWLLATVLSVMIIFTAAAIKVPTGMTPGQGCPEMENPTCDDYCSYTEHSNQLGCIGSCYDENDMSCVNYCWLNQNDPGCNVIFQPQPENTQARCMDFIDNDADVAVDCQDTDCEGIPCSAQMSVCPSGSSGPGGPSKVCGGGLCNQMSYVCTETNCFDNIDNDADGNTDCADPDCDGQMCFSIPCPAGSAGVQLTKSCVQGSCSAPTGCAEINCLDGVDNDLDGGADGADYDCPHADLVPVSFTYNGYFDAVYDSATNTWTKKHYYTIGTKNIGIKTTSHWMFIINLTDANGGDLATCGYGSNIAAGETGGCSISLLSQVPSRVKVFVDSTNLQVEPNKTNNIAFFDV